MTALELQNLHPELLRHVKICTVQRCLQKELDLPSHKLAKKTADYQENEDKMACICKEIHLTPKQWRKVMFYDESSFQVFKMGSTTVWHPRSSDRFDPLYTISTVKHLQLVMVWGYFLGEKGRGGLYFLPKNKKMNAELYLQVLEEHMLSKEEHKMSKKKTPNFEILQEELKKVWYREMSMEYF